MQTETQIVSLFGNDLGIVLFTYRVVFQWPAHSTDESFQFEISFEHRIIDQHSRSWGVQMTDLFFFVFSKKWVVSERVLSQGISLAANYFIL